MARLARRRLVQSILLSLLGIVMVMVLLPIIWIFLTSLKTGAQAWSRPPIVIFQPILDAYENILGGKAYFYGGRFYSALWNSVVISVVATLLSVLIAPPGSYSLSRFQFLGKKPLAFAILASRMLPPVATVNPFFMIMNALGLVDTQLCLILIYTGFNVPIAVWMLRPFFDAIPRELEEAAMIDGCSRFNALIRVVAPLAAPGLAATSIFLYMISWNDFVFALIFTAKQAKTIPVTVAELITETGVHWPEMAATGTIAMMPVLTFAFLVQKHLIKGLTLGAVKG